MESNKTTSATPPSPPAVVDYTERAREIVSDVNWLRDNGQLSDATEHVADALSAVASEHQAALLERLREPEMREALRESMMSLYGWKPETGHLNTEAADEMADAAIAIIKEKLNG